MAQRSEQPEQRVDERRLVLRWRREQFSALGFTSAEARRMTAASIDLGDMRRLIRAGCPPETARRILL